MNNIRFIKKVKVIDNSFVEKEENDLTDLYEYLKSRNFTNILPLIERVDNKYNKYNYIENVNINKYQRSEELIKVVSSLHNKTSYNKEVSQNIYKRIYDNLNGYINYLDKYYSDLISNIEYHEFLSPAEQIIINNYYKLIEVFNFLRLELEKWYSLVKNSNKERVCLNHGKLDLSHLLIKDQTYLISFDAYNFSSPINDLIYLYKKEWNNLDFKEMLDYYMKNSPLSESELKLFIINITIPLKFEYTNNKYKNTCLANALMRYIYKTEDLIRPYYSNNDTK